MAKSVLLLDARRIAGVEQASGATVSLDDGLAAELVGLKLASYVSRQTVPDNATVHGRYDVRKYGARVDGRVVNDATLAARTGAGNTTITSATIGFTRADVGKRFGINSTAATPSYPIVSGYIVSVESATSATVAVLATVAAIASAGSLCVVSDDSVAVQTAIAAATESGGDVYFPPGICGYGDAAGAEISLPYGVNFVGSGNANGNPLRFSSKGSTLVGVQATYVSGTFVTLAGGGQSVRDMNIDGAHRRDIVISVSLTQCKLLHSTIGRGLANSVKYNAGSSLVQGCYIYQGFRGLPLEMPGDAIVLDNYIFGAGDTYANLKVNGPTDDALVSGNHFYKAGWGTTLSAVTGPNLQFYQFSTTDTGGGVIANNVFDTSEGNHIDIQVFNTNATAPLKALTISNNQFYQPQPFTTDTFACIKIKVGSGGANNVSVRGLSITGNVGKGYAASSRSYLAFILWDIDATYGAIYGDSIVGNCIDNCTNLYSGTHTPGYTAGNCTIAGTGTTVAVG